MTRIMIIGGNNISLIKFRGDLIKEWLHLGHEVLAVAPGVEVKKKVKTLGAGYNSFRMSMNF